MKIFGLKFVVCLGGVGSGWVGTHAWKTCARWKKVGSHVGCRAVPAKFKKRDIQIRTTSESPTLLGKSVSEYLHANKASVEKLWQTQKLGGMKRMWLTVLWGSCYFCSLSFFLRTRAEHCCFHLLCHFYFNFQHTLERGEVGFSSFHFFLLIPSKFFKLGVWDENLVLHPKLNAQRGSCYAFGENCLLRHNRCKAELEHPTGVQEFLSAMIKKPWISTMEVNNFARNWVINCGAVLNCCIDLQFVLRKWGCGLVPGQWSLVLCWMKLRACQRWTACICSCYWISLLYSK